MWGHIRFDLKEICVSVRNWMEAAQESIGDFLWMRYWTKKYMSKWETGWTQLKRVLETSCERDIEQINICQSEKLDGFSSREYWKLPVNAILNKEICVSVRNWMESVQECIGNFLWTRYWTKKCMSVWEIGWSQFKRVLETSCECDIEPSGYHEKFLNHSSIALETKF